LPDPLTPDRPNQETIWVNRQIHLDEELDDDDDGIPDAFRAGTE
jgi:hypothetical protein